MLVNIFPLQPFSTNVMLRMGSAKAPIISSDSKNPEGYWAKLQD